MPELWVVNPKREPKPNSAHAGDYDTFKRKAEIRMARFDRLPKSVRRAVHEYDQLGAALRWRYAAEKIAAVKTAYQEMLDRSAIKLEV